MKIVWACWICDKEFGSIDELKHHILTDHKKLFEGESISLDKGIGGFGYPTEILLKDPQTNKMKSWLSVEKSITNTLKNRGFNVKCSILPKREWRDWYLHFIITPREYISPTKFIELINFTHNLIAWVVGDNPTIMVALKCFGACKDDTNSGCLDFRIKIA